VYSIHFHQDDDGPAGYAKSVEEAKDIISLWHPDKDGLHLGKTNPWARAKLVVTEEEETVFLTMPAEEGYRAVVWRLDPCDPIAVANYKKKLEEPEEKEKEKVWQLYQEDDPKAFEDVKPFADLDAVLDKFDKVSHEGSHNAERVSGFSVYKILNAAGEACCYVRNIKRSRLVPETPNKWESI